MQRHTDPTVLIDYALGRLSRRNAAEVRAHCMQCVECGDQLAAAIALRMHASSTADQSVDWRRVAAVAAAVVLAVGIAAIGFVGDGSVERGLATGVETVADGSGVAAVSPWVSTATAEDIADFERRVRMLSRMLGTATVVSSGADRETRLRTAMERLSIHDLPGMAEVLEPFADSYDRWGTPLLGVARYLQGNEGPETIACLEAAYARAFGDASDPGDTYVERVAALYLARLKRDRGQAERAEEILLTLLPYDDDLGSDARVLLDESPSTSR